MDALRNSGAPKRNRAGQVRFKADDLFSIRYMLGPDRWIRKLTEVCITIGSKIALSTLLQDSSRYHRQRGASC